MFGRRFNFLTFAGIKIGFDISWFFIAILFSWSLAVGYFPYYYPQFSLQLFWLMGVTGTLGLFICIVLHELGHALVAKYFKLPISQITLFIFGGVAEIKKEPHSPKIEFLVAVAGPLVSLFLAALLYLITLAGQQWGWPIPVIAVTKYLALINVTIVLFNLVPAFPLDGGRIFRSILWGIKKDLGWATQISTRIGTAFGWTLCLLGLLTIIGGSFLSGFWLIILGLFLQRAATSSRTQYYVGRVLRGEKVQRFMTKDPISVPPHITIKEFVDEYVYSSYHHFYPVTEQGRLLGYISLKEVKSLPLEKWDRTRVENVMVHSSQLKTISPETSALEALNRLNEIEAPLLLVVKDGHLVGLLTVQDLFKWIAIKLELGSLK